MLVCNKHLEAFQLRISIYEITHDYMKYFPFLSRFFRHKNLQFYIFMYHANIYCPCTLSFQAQVKKSLT